MGTTPNIVLLCRISLQITSKESEKVQKRGHLLHLSLFLNSVIFSLLASCKYHGESPCKYKGG